MDCVLSFYETDPESNRLASLLGATVTDQIVANFTTHVIAQYMTPILKHQLQML